MTAMPTFDELVDPAALAELKALADQPLTDDEWDAWEAKHLDIDLETKVKKVRTPEGARKYGEPIGTPITLDMVRRVRKEGGKIASSGGKDRRGEVARAATPKKPTDVEAARKGTAKATATVERMNEDVAGKRVKPGRYYRVGKNGPGAGGVYEADAAGHVTHLHSSHQHGRSKLNSSQSEQVVQGIASGNFVHEDKVPPDMVKMAADEHGFDAGVSPEAKPKAPVIKPVKVPKEAAAAIKDIAVDGKPEGKGTPDDPIDVGDDLDRAVQLLGEGKHVRLKHTVEVGTVLEKLTAVVEHAKAAGQEAPDYNLCAISVPGTNLFCQESKGVPRTKMPQFSGEAIEGSVAQKLMGPDDTEANVTSYFRQALADRGISITPKTVKASSLRASQDELDGPKVAGMAKAMEAGKIPEAPIFVTRDGYVIDGHHRWAAKVSIDARDGQLGDIDMPIDEVDLDIGAALDFANAFADAMGIKRKGLGAAAEAVESTATPEAPKPMPDLPPEKKALSFATISELVDHMLERKANNEEQAMEVKGPEPVNGLEHKSDGGTTVIAADDETGMVTAIVSVTGVEDRVQDIIEPKAYTETLATRDPIGVWSHDDKTWVARAEEVKELLPGDPFFRSAEFLAKMQQAKKEWPAAAGALLVKARFNLETPHGAAAYSDVKFFEGKAGWSIGYRVKSSKRDPRSGVRRIKSLDLFEFSPVMVGAAHEAMTLSVKSLADAHRVDPDVEIGLIELADPAEVKDLLAARADLYAALEGKVFTAVDETKTAAIAEPSGVVADPTAAMPDGSFAIANEDDLKAALKAVDEASDADAVRAHMQKRAKALGLQHVLRGTKGFEVDADEALLEHKALAERLEVKAEAELVEPDWSIAEADGGPDEAARIAAYEAATAEGTLSDSELRGTYWPEPADEQVAADAKANADEPTEDEVKQAERAGVTLEQARALKAEFAAELAALDETKDVHTGSAPSQSTRGFGKTAFEGGSNRGVITGSTLATVCKGCGSKSRRKVKGIVQCAMCGTSLQHKIDDELVAQITEAQAALNDLLTKAGIDMLDEDLDNGDAPTVGEPEPEDDGDEEFDLGDEVDTSLEDEALAIQAEIVDALGDDDDEDLEPEDAEAELAKYVGIGAEAKAMTHEPLDRSPKKNWVERSGQLPAYIQHIAKDIHEEQGKTLSHAIAIAIAAVKRWAVGGGNVNADTRAKAAAAVAEWEALKAKNKVRKAGKAVGRAVRGAAKDDSKAFTVEWWDGLGDDVKSYAVGELLGDVDWEVEIPEDEDKSVLKRVRTHEGEREFRLPIGSLIHPNRPHALHGGAAGKPPHVSTLSDSELEGVVNGGSNDMRSHLRRHEAIVESGRRKAAALEAAKPDHLHTDGRGHDATQNRLAGELADYNRAHPGAGADDPGRKRLVEALAAHNAGHAGSHAKPDAAAVARAETASDRYNRLGEREAHDPDHLAHSIQSAADGRSELSLHEVEQHLTRHGVTDRESLQKVVGKLRKRGIRVRITNEGKALLWPDAFVTDEKGYIEVEDQATIISEGELLRHRSLALLID